ncbi:GspH/FimT family pseudopilin [Oceanicoccus sagamiensis]|uniref:Type II secretion system protein H n=1 Tax=Oceanicoccus sagamiensis TaxID=716816 RepID=A0A1X9NE90_9GAMM|nr:GspH/FimT family pseudopilin [Oceanicoccus sagamiensis]ARN75471.1 hypothetical protein BST96_15955 [Oceanicoccus sagamiensis]
MKKKQYGLNLIELMAVMVVLAVIMSTGVPALQNTIASTAVNAEARSIYKSITAARNEAINKNSVVTLARKGSSANNWSEGWITYIDAGQEGNQAINTADGDLLLSDFTVAQDAVTVYTNAAANNWITFDADGRLDDNPIEIAVCNLDRDNGLDGSMIAISRAGRVSISIIDAADKTSQCSP